MGVLDTVTIVDPNDPKDTRVINRSAYDPKKHKLAQSKVEAPKLPDPASTVEGGKSKKEVEFK